jgi:hypothetical protein
MGQGRTVACDTHGSAHAAFVCSHLIARPEQEWYCDYPSRKDPFPDAWCAECESVVEREQGWSDQACAFADIKVICGQCYANLQSRSIPALEDAVRTEWEAFVASCRESLGARQPLLDSHFGIGGYERYDYDQATKQIVFSTQGKPGVIAEIEVVGTLSRAAGTWMWSWANFSMLPKVGTRMKRVRTLGEQRRFPRLNTYLWPADEVDAWDMAAIAAHVLRAQGVYRSPGESTDMYMTLSKIRRCDGTNAATP